MRLTGQPAPVWCPGQKITYRYYINADHNGVYRWEAQHVSAPGDETEVSTAAAAMGVVRGIEGVG